MQSFLLIWGSSISSMTSALSNKPTHSQARPPRSGRGFAAADSLATLRDAGREKAGFADTLCLLLLPAARIVLRRIFRRSCFCYLWKTGS